MPWPVGACMPSLWRSYDQYDGITCKGQPHLKDARKVVESVMEGWRRLHDGRVALLFEVGHHDVVVGLPELGHLKSRSLVIDTNKIWTSVVAKKIKS